MKLMFSVEGNNLESEIAEHFGRCPFFILVTVENKKIKSFEAIENPYFKDHKPFAVPNFISKINPDVFICKGIGPRAITALSELKIDLIYGCSGKVKDVVDDFLNDNLKNDVNVCHHV